MAPDTSRQRSGAGACGTGGPDRGHAVPVGERSASSRRRCGDAAQMAGPSPGVRAAEERLISACRTAPLAKIVITPPNRRLPLGQARELTLTPTCAPGQQGSRPRDLHLGQIPKKLQTTIPVLRRGNDPCQRKSVGFGASGAKVLATG